MSDPAAHHDTPTAPGVEVVKWYTRARRFPQLIGRTSDGTKLPGGPYTYTQVGLGVGVLLVGQKTARLWAHFGTATNVVVLVGITAAVVFLAGRLPIGGRNPLSLASGAVQAFTAPRHGRYRGVPVRAGKPQRTGSTRLIVLAPATQAGSPAPASGGVAAVDHDQVTGEMSIPVEQSSLEELLEPGQSHHCPTRARGGLWHRRGRRLDGATALTAPASPTADQTIPEPAIPEPAISNQPVPDRASGPRSTTSPLQPVTTPPAAGAPLTGVQRLLAQSRSSATAVKDPR